MQSSNMKVRRCYPAILVDNLVMSYESRQIIGGVHELTAPLCIKIKIRHVSLSIEPINVMGDG